MSSILIKNAKVVSDSITYPADILIYQGVIQKIITEPQQYEEVRHIKIDKTIDAKGKYLIPGVIDDQVHFREPGLTYKADIYSESRAAIAGGITSYMEMPNTTPAAVTLDLLEQKYQIAAEKSLANYSFYMGATNENIAEITKINPKNICGIKLFMGSSTGNMLVDSGKSLEAIFAESPCLIATHCEDEAIIKANTEKYKKIYGEDAPASCHPEIRTAEACYRSSSLAAELATRYNSRLHILHLTTALEMSIFSAGDPAKKKITSEVCAHHLWFNSRNYETLGNKIKCNPAIKSEEDRLALWDALKSGKLDVIATDHAPHTLEEKQNKYFLAPSGLPLVQHSLPMMLEWWKRGEITIEEVVYKMCHTPAIVFGIEKRGFIKEGYFADLVLVDDTETWTVEKSNIIYKCGWSPMEDTSFNTKVTHTFVNGSLVYENGSFDESNTGQRLIFNR